MFEDTPLEPSFSSSSETAVSLKRAERCFKAKAPSTGPQEWLPAAETAWSWVLSTQETGQQCGHKSPPLQPGDEPGWQSSLVPIPGACEIVSLHTGVPGISHKCGYLQGSPSMPGLPRHVGPHAVLGGRPVTHRVPWAPRGWGTANLPSVKLPRTAQAFCASPCSAMPLPSVMALLARLATLRSHQTQMQAVLWNAKPE